MARRITRTRFIKHVIDGETEWIPDDYEVPAPTIDWDHVVLNGVFGTAAVFVAGSMTWTTASIGDLLAQTVPAPIAYTASGAYDAAWVACLALEWLSRYDRQRAKGPRWAGHAALLVAVAAVVIHGCTLGDAWAGAVGGVVSVLAKGLWTLVIRHIAAPLDERTQKWLQSRRSRYGARMAIGAQMRQLRRMDEQYAALAGVSGVYADNACPDSTDTDRTPDIDAADTAPVRPAMAPGTVRSAILGAATAWPDEDAPDITARLAGLGIDTDTDTVRAVLEDTDEDTRPDADTVVRSIGSPRRGPSDTNVVAEAVRAARIAGVQRHEVLAHVRGVLGPEVKSDAVRKAWVRSTEKTGKVAR